MSNQQLYQAIHYELVASAKAVQLAHSIDPTCFLIVSHVTEVSGRGFSMDKDYL